MTYSYYAFISYSRKDKIYARYLQSKLENYRYPVALVHGEYMPENPKYLRKIFRDTNDLDVTQNNFTESINQHIARSRYLIVLCSPNSAQSIWVNREICRFLETHDNNMKLVFPIIADGTVPDCLPEKLRCDEFLNRNIPTMIPDDASSQKEGWEHGFLQLVGCLLCVSIEKITDRFQKAKQIMLRRIVFGALAALILTSGLTCWALIAERKAKTAERQARREAEVAQETLNFLEKAFDAADTTISGKKDMTLLDFARETSGKLEEIKNLEVRCKVAMITLSLVANMGDPQTALKNYEQLLPIARTALTPNYFAVFYYRYATLLVCNSEYLKALKILKAMYDAKAFSLDNEMRSELLNRIGISYQALGDYGKSVEYLQKAVEILSAESKQKAGILQNLGMSYTKKGELKAAYRCFEKALELLNSAGCTNHPTYSAVLGNMSKLLIDMCEYDKAFEYVKKSLQIKERTLGRNHPRCVIDLITMGQICEIKGDHKQAIRYFEQALSTVEYRFGKDHAQCVYALTNLGVAYYASGEYEKAFGYYQHALKIAENGKVNNATIAGILVNVAWIHFERKEYEKTVSCFQKSLSIQIGIYGKKDPHCAVCYFGAGAAYHAMGDYRKALEYYQMAAEIECRLLNGTDVHYAKTLNNMGNLYSDMKDFKKAIECYRKSLKIKAERYGYAHFDTLRTLHNLADAYVQNGEPDKADYYFKLALKHSSGLKGTSYASELNNIGYFYRKNGAYSLGVKYFLKALEIYRDHLDQDQDHCITTLWNLANSCREGKGFYDEAIQAYRKLLPVMVRKNGKDHPDSLTLLSMLGHACVMTGNTREGLTDLEYVISALKKKSEPMHIQLAETYHFLGLAYLEAFRQTKQYEYLENARYNMTKAFEIRKIKLKTDDPERKETESVLKTISGMMK